MRVLIVEDDKLLGDGLASGLRSSGFVVDWMTDAERADRAVESAPYDAVILDLGLPGRGGLELLAQWQARGRTTPVLILTARDALPSRVEGLDGGADDYLVKPVALEELAARLRAIARRARGRPEVVWKHGPLDFSPSARSATWHGRAVDLTAREALVLELLLANPGRVMPKARIEESLYGWDEEVGSNVLEVHVHNLRRKIAPSIVRTVRGVGYALGPPEPETPL